MIIIMGTFCRGFYEKYTLAYKSSLSDCGNHYVFPEDVFQNSVFFIDSIKRKVR